MLNVAGTDGANSPASDLMRRAPNAVIVMFRTTLDRNSAAEFDKWLASCDTTRAPAWQAKLRRSLAMQMTASSLLNMMEQAEASSAQFPVDCHAVIAPIQSQLHSVCHKLVSDYM
jgi:octaprenyl-diphosphate synthase